jgi:hypothetical protein
MKVVKIKTDIKWDELTEGKVYNALPRKDTLAPYVNSYIFFVENHNIQYYRIEKNDRETLNYLYPISEFKTIEEIREEKIENILSL